MARRKEVPQLTEGKNLRDMRWWKADDDDVASSVMSRCLWIRQRQKYRKSMDMFHARLYDGAVGVFGSMVDIDGEYDPAQLPFNVVRNGIDTLVALIIKNRPLPQVLTSGADRKEQKKAEYMSKAIEGELYKARFWKMRPMIVRDACIFGTGIVHVYRQEKRVFIERVIPTELLVDRADSARGSPRTIYFTRTVDRWALAEQFPDLKDEIIAAPPTDHNEHEFVWLDENEDRLMVIDAYRIPDNAEMVEEGDEPVGGRHLMVVSGVSKPLLDEEWTKPYFPFCFLRKSEQVAGFWGVGIAQEMAGFQLEINVVADKLQSAHHLLGGGHILVAAGSDIVDSDLTNGIGHIIKYKGQPPIWENPTPVNDATYMYLQDLGKFALAYSGISNMSAQSSKPPGVTAARALLVLDDIETQRFMTFARADEEWVVDIAHQIVDLVAEIVEEHPDYLIKVPQERLMVPIKWSECELKKEAYVLQVFPTSLLAKTPAARLQMVQDLFNAKVIDRAMFLKLLNAPDINAEQDLEASGREVADEQIQHMLDATPNQQDAYQPPDEYQDLVYSMHRAQAQLNLWKMRGLKDFNRTLLTDYISECHDLMQKAMQQPEVPLGGEQQGAPGVPVNLPGAQIPPTEQMSRPTG